jgi:PleD family two-component response regulator/EAL domain-containing protein (putative c-di-GMP-specific phosphodiesterase class I)
MQAGESQQQSAELRQAFLRHLPTRVERMSRRGRQLLSVGWDINALSLLHRDAQALAGAAGRYGALEASETLYALELALQPFIEGTALPDPAQGERIGALVQRLARVAGEIALRVQDAPALRPIAGGDPFTALSPLHRPAPPQYWRRLGVADLPAAPPPAPSAVATPKPAAPAVSAATAAVPSSAPRPAAGARRIYLLDPGDPLLAEAAELLRREGHDVERFEDVAEFNEVLSALTPDVAIVGNLAEADLQAVGERIRQSRQRGGARVLFVVLGARDDLSQRLAALRAGADAFHAPPLSPAALVGDVREHLRSEPADAYRVLIVEDDRSQALFAESILRNAGFETRSETDPLRVLAVLDEFEPDLILMDLYMPNVDGMELTAIIRERERFIGVPIVFLSGEQDEEKHFAALDAGGDDFLAKPIRPKHLIAAVTNRIRRARVSRRAQRDPARRDPATGLYQRPFVIDRLSAALAAETVAVGGLLFVEIDDAPGLRERITLSGFETLSGQLGALLASTAGEAALCARFNDRAFLVFLPEAGAEALVEQSRHLLAVIQSQRFDLEQQSVTVEVNIGACPLGLGFADAGALLTAAERAARAARERPERLFLVRPSPAPVAAGTGRDALDQAVEAAIQGDGFDFLYQPILPVVDRGEQIYQVLLRLRDEQGSLRTAAEILPVAERLGRLPDLDRTVLARALRALSERLQQGRPITLVVSQSRASLTRAEHGPWIQSMLETRGVPGERLIIDLRRETLIQALPHVQGLREHLARRGVRFCISGFDGTEEAFASIASFRPAWIRLDPRLVAEDSTAARQTLAGIVERAHQLGIEIVAPQVEGAEAAARAWSGGVDYIQGHFVHAGSGEPDFDFHHLG